jgi:WhiB family redox-sensing transcriptional regulator
MPLTHDRSGTSAPNAPGPEAARNPDWRDEAACRHADPDLFFPISTTGSALSQIDDAKRICRACPARTQCLAWALDNSIPYGVWGATTEEERRAIRRDRRREFGRSVKAATALTQAS